MRIPQEKNFDVVQFRQDRQAYNYWFRRQFGVDEDEDTAQKIADTIYAAVRIELSEKQRLYFSEYYFEGLTVEEIADSHGVNKSSVSRGLVRSRKRMERVLKYVDRKLLKLFEQADRPKKRYNKAGRKKFKANQN